MTCRITTGWTSGLIAWVTGAHAIYYAREWNFGTDFEAQVAHGLGGFALRYDATRDAIFRAQNAAGETIGSITIDGGYAGLADGSAKLRWFITSDAARGSGAGKALLAASMRFLDDVGYKRCELETFKGLETAALLYSRAGFTLMHQGPSDAWGLPVEKQDWVRQR